MIKHSKKKVGLILVALLTVSLAIPTAAQAEPAGPSTVTTATDVLEISSQIMNDPEARYVGVAEANEQFGYDSNENAASSEPGISPYSSWWGCDYEGSADYPHVRSNQASGHSYWAHTGGVCPTTATVTVNLQALLCSSMFGCTWVTQATDSGTFNPGSGTGKWATPHKNCANSNLVGWRGQVDVNLTDFADPPGYHYGTAKNISCSPA